MFLGWHLSPGAKWRGGYAVVALEDFKDVAIEGWAQRVAQKAQRTREVYLPEGEIVFPLQEHRERSEQTLLDGGLHTTAPFEVPPSALLTL